jgi:hypothetical protein
VKSLSKALQKRPDVDVFVIFWRVASGADMGKPETRQVVYDRRAETLEYQLNPGFSQKWWGWTNVEKNDIDVVANKTGHFKDLESLGSKFIPYSGPIH